MNVKINLLNFDTVSTITVVVMTMCDKVVLSLLTTTYHSEDSRKINLENIN